MTRAEWGRLLVGLALVLAVGRGLWGCYQLAHEVAADMERVRAARVAAAEGRTR